MDVRLLRRLDSFVAVAEYRSFSEASKNLFISQPFLSRQVQDLERALGLTLFQRKGGRLALTEAGLSLLDHATKIKEQAEEMERQMRILAAGESGLLKLGAANANWNHVLPGVMAAFKKSHPNISLSLVTVSEPQVPQRLLDNMIHLGFVSRVPAQRGLETTLVTRDEIIIVAPPSHALADGRKHAPAELNSAPLVLYGGQTQGELTTAGFLRMVGITPRVSVEVENAEAIKLAVIAGLGIAVSTRFIAMRDLASGALVEVLISGPRHSSPLYMVRNPAYITSAQKAFIEHIARLGSIKMVGGKKQAGLRRLPPA